MKRPNANAKLIRHRLSQEERKEAIAHAAAKLFAERGFHATGTRELARACGISEALMFRYFPNKEVLWKAALESCRRNAIADSLRSLSTRRPSTAGLVDMTWELADDFLLKERGERGENGRTIHRMQLRSLAEDGEFARMLALDLSVRMTTFVLECLTAARAAGDLESASNDDLIACKFYRLLFFAIGAHLLPKRSVMQFEITDRLLVENIVRFQLRALGLKSKAIDREISARAKDRRSRADDLRPTSSEDASREARKTKLPPVPTAAKRHG